MSKDATPTRPPPSSAPVPESPPRQAEEAREAVVAERNAREQSVAERAALKAAMEAEQNLVVSELDAAITKLADGDLTSRLNQTFAERYEGLRANFNEALERLEAAMGDTLIEEMPMKFASSPSPARKARKKEASSAPIVETRMMTRRSSLSE